MDAPAPRGQVRRSGGGFPPPSAVLMSGHNDQTKQLTNQSPFRNSEGEEERGRGKRKRKKTKTYSSDEDWTPESESRTSRLEGKGKKKKREVSSPEDEDDPSLAPPPPFTHQPNHPLSNQGQPSISRGGQMQNAFYPGSSSMAQPQRGKKSPHQQDFPGGGMMIGGVDPFQMGGGAMPPGFDMGPPRPGGGMMDPSGAGYPPMSFPPSQFMMTPEGMAAMGNGMMPGQGPMMMPQGFPPGYPPHFQQPRQQQQQQPPQPGGPNPFQPSPYGQPPAGPNGYRMPGGPPQQYPPYPGMPMGQPGFDFGAPGFGPGGNPTSSSRSSFPSPHRPQQQQPQQRQKNAQPPTNSSNSMAPFYPSAPTSSAQAFPTSLVGDLPLPQVTSTSAASLFPSPFALPGTANAGDGGKGGQQQRSMAPATSSLGIPESILRGLNKSDPKAAMASAAGQQLQSSTYPLKLNLSPPFLPTSHAPPAVNGSSGRPAPRANPPQHQPSHLPPTRQHQQQHQPSQFMQQQQRQKQHSGVMMVKGPSPAPPSTSTAPPSQQQQPRVGPSSTTSKPASSGQRAPSGLLAVSDQVEEEAVVATVVTAFRAGQLNMKDGATLKGELAKALRRTEEDIQTTYPVYCGEQWVFHSADFLGVTRGQILAAEQRIERMVDLLRKPGKPAKHRGQGGENGSSGGGRSKNGNHHQHSHEDHHEGRRNGHASSSPNEGANSSTSHKRSERSSEDDDDDEGTGGDAMPSDTESDRSQRHQGFDSQSEEDEGPAPSSNTSAV